MTVTATMTEKNLLDMNVDDDVDKDADSDDNGEKFVRYERRR